MKTELQQIAKATRIYEGYTESSHAEWVDAERYLITVHNRYGTININTIKQLIR